MVGDGGLQNAADFWLAVQLDELRDDDGALDPAKIKAARPSEPKGAPSFGEAVKRAG